MNRWSEQSLHPVAKSGWSLAATSGPREAFQSLAEATLVVLEKLPFDIPIQIFVHWELEIPGENLRSFLLPFCR